MLLTAGTRLSATTALVALAACLVVARPAAAPPRAVQIAADLQRDIDRIVAGAGLEQASWGIVVQSLTANDTLYAANAGKLMMPASALKLVTLAAAAEHLGWDYAYETRLVPDGTVQGGTLEGNLVIVGSGDPSLDRPTLDSWADSLKGAGITRITGTVVADARAFRGEGLGFGWSWDDLAYYYAAPIAAAQFRENAVELTLLAGASAGAPVAFEVSPAGIHGLRIESRMQTGEANVPAEFVARRPANSTSVVLEGVMPAGARPAVQRLSIHDPPRFLAAAFAEALPARGVSLGARPAPEQGPVTLGEYANATPLLTHKSAPLRFLARRLMEVSQNQYAETLIKTMGARAGTPTFEGGLKAVESVLAAWGLSAADAILRDGSGLSRYNYVTPRLLVQILTRMYREPAHNGPFFGALNGAGQNGTLAGRLRSTAAAGNVRAKDGSMSGVRALAGLVYTADGEPLAFAILANNFSPGPVATAAIDAIVVKLAEFRR